ncbi:MAG TPA: adenosine deaminase [Candidatus Corynebacterium avicola]|uniref:adenosine deaminase n=1 Tax=Candidatus Corynebacterium avicola TaxID=2838527 RepID=A0A9D1UK60_9CORY|nr:adenosine deaminase [Candidatus Corynebacterium avicola]
MSDSDFEPTSTVDPQVVKRLPKVVLHDHLDGGLRPQTIIDIAAETGYDGLPTTDAAELEKWFFDSANSGDLPTYLTTFDHTTAVMQTADALVRVTREAVEDLAADGVCYAELRYAPEQHQAKGLSLQEVVDATVQGVKEGERAVAASGGRIHARLLLCAMRHADRGAEIAQLTVDNHGAHTPGEGYVVGFDIAGAEDGFPPSNHVEAFRILRENLVPVTVHAGEAAGVESIADGLRQGAVRIGHGVRIYEDLDATMNGIELGEIATFIRDRQIPLEVCPTSNTQTGVCDTVADHPFSLLYEMGFACTVNTDNRLVSGCSMSSEFEALAEAFGMEYWQFLEMTTNALDNAFCDQPLREALEREVIYPAYAELGDTLGAGEGAAGGLGHLHGEGEDEHDHAHEHGQGFGTEEVELSMENLRAELESLGLSLDDGEDEDDADDADEGSDK